MQFDPTLVTLGTTPTVLHDRLLIQYELHNGSPTIVYVENRYPEERIHRGSLRREPYTTSSAATYLLSGGEVLVFQGQTILEGPPFPYAPPRRIACSIVRPGTSHKASIELRLPLRQNHTGVDAAALSQERPLSALTTASVLIFALEMNAAPASVRELDGTDAVQVESNTWWRIVQRLSLPHPIQVGHGSTDWGDEHMRIIRERLSAHQGQCTYE